MNRRTKLLLTLAGAGLLLLAVVVGLSLRLAPVSRPGPETRPTVTPDFVINERWIEALPTPMSGGVFIAGFNYSTPPPLPTTSKWWTAGAKAPVGVECNGYLGYNVAGDHPGTGAVWETQPSGCTGFSCSNYGINWAYADACVTGAAGVSVTTGAGKTAPQSIMLAVPPYILDQGGSGTSGDPFGDEQIPDWLESACLSTFTYDSKTYNRINYDNDTCKGWLKTFIQQAGARYSNNSQLVMVRVCIGFQCESQPVKCGTGHSACVQASLIGAMESSGVTCAEYRAFMKELVDTAKTAFPKQIVTFNGAPQACNTSPYKSGEALRYNFYENTSDGNPGWGSLNTPVALSIHGMEPDREDAHKWTSSVSEEEGYGLIEAMRTVNDDFGFGAVGEYWANPTDIGSDDPWQYHAWAAYAVAGIGADFIGPWWPWRDFWTNEFFYVTQEKMSNAHPEHAWTILREMEQPRYTWNSGTYGQSGIPGDFGRYLAVLTPTAYPQACNSYIKGEATKTVATVVAAGNSLAYNPCPLALPTPAMTKQPTPVADANGETNMLNRILNRQARQIGASGTMGLALSPAWTYFGSSHDVALTVRYLDTGTDDVTVDVATAGGAASHTIDRQNTRVWREEAWTVSGAQLGNGIAVSGRGNAFIRLTNGTTPLYLHEVSFTVQQETAPTPTPTRTLTPSPTPTRTPTATTTTIFVPSPTPVSPWPEQACPNRPTINIDGDLADWAGVTGVTLSASAASYLFPGTPVPTTGDISATFYCAHAGSALFLAGVVTDDAISVPTGNLSGGDAAEVGLDGRADGALKLVVDDHDLLIAGGASLEWRNFDTLPTEGTLAKSTFSGGWRFELSIPTTAHGAGQLATGQIVGLTWGLVDNDGGSAQVLTLGKRSGRMGAP